MIPGISAYASRLSAPTDARGRARLARGADPRGAARPRRRRRAAARRRAGERAARRRRPSTPTGRPCRPLWRGRASCAAASSRPARPTAARPSRATAPRAGSRSPRDGSCAAIRGRRAATTRSRSRPLTPGLRAGRRGRTRLDSSRCGARLAGLKHPSEARVEAHAAAAAASAGMRTFCPAPSRREPPAGARPNGRADPKPREPERPRVWRSASRIRSAACALAGRSAAPHHPRSLSQSERGDDSEWCRRPDSNRHGLPHTPLKRTCLPIPPRRHGGRFYGFAGLPEAGDGRAGGRSRRSGRRRARRARRTRAAGGRSGAGAFCAAAAGSVLDDRGLRPRLDDREQQREHDEADEGAGRQLVEERRRAAGAEGGLARRRRRRRRRCPRPCPAGAGPPGSGRSR